LTDLDAPVPNPVIELTKQRKSYEGCEEEKKTTAKAFHERPPSFKRKGWGDPPRSSHVNSWQGSPVAPYADKRSPWLSPISSRTTVLFLAKMKFACGLTPERYSNYSRKQETLSHGVVERKKGIVRT
jgi:hypothetical protein